AVLPAEQVGVEVAEHADHPRLWDPGRWTARREQRLVADPHLLDVLCDRLESRPHVAKGKPGPVGEVAVRGGSECPEIAPRELRERPPAVEWRQPAQPVLPAYQAGAGA